MRAQLREGTLIPPGLVNSFDPPLIQGVDADAPAPAGAIPTLAAGVEPWRALFKALKLSALEVGAIGPDVCGPDAAAAEAMLRADPEYATALDAMAASRRQLGRGSYEINYVKAFTKVRELFGVQMGASRRNRGNVRAHFSDAAQTHVVIRCSCASAASRWIPTSTATRRSGPTCGCEGRIAAAGAWDCQRPVCQLTASQACFDSPRAAPSAPRARRARARA